MNVQLLQSEQRITVLLCLRRRDFCFYLRKKNYNKMTSVFFLSYIFNILYNFIIYCKSDLLSISFNLEWFLHKMCEVGVTWNRSCRADESCAVCPVPLPSHGDSQEIPKALSCFYVLLPGWSHTAFKKKKKIKIYLLHSISPVLI